MADVFIKEVYILFGLKESLPKKKYVLCFLSGKSLFINPWKTKPRFFFYTEFV